MNTTELIKSRIQASVDTKLKWMNDSAMIERLEKIADLVVGTFKNDGKVLFCGNGGSAADAQHLAAEFSGRFYTDREPLYAEALHVNTSYVTAVANDYSYNEVYARMVKAAGRKGDVLFAISTSGNSPNILLAIEAARQRNMIVVGMTGESGGKMREACDYLLNVPSADTPRIQESHILMGHIICELTEKMYFNP